MPYITKVLSCCLLSVIHLFCCFVDFLSSWNRSVRYFLSRLSYWQSKYSNKQISKRVITKMVATFWRRGLIYSKKKKRKTTTRSEWRPKAKKEKVFCILNMGVCKCKQRNVTNQFCYVCRMNVCESCMIKDHQRVSIFPLSFLEEGRPLRIVAP